MNTRARTRTLSTVFSIKIKRRAERPNAQIFRGRGEYTKITVSSEALLFVCVESLFVDCLVVAVIRLHDMTRTTSQ
jgi:hypothetical protein